MLIVELAFTDAPERLAARPAHRELLDRLHRDGRLHAAGPWADDTGALLIFDTDPPGLEDVMSMDPYYRTPGVEVVRISEWNPVAGP